MLSSFDTIIKNGLWFDGTGVAPSVRHLGIRNGHVTAIAKQPLPENDGCEVIDADGQWVLPGFVDIHTHYDAEVLVAPGLKESVRHGVTSIFLGSCSLSTVFSGPFDCTDMFSRVEAIPREQMLNALRGKTWSTPVEYVQHLESLPLGPNVAAFLGHSDLRAHVLGLGRAVDDKVRPDKSELKRMSQLLDDALDAGFVGLSGMTTPWDKLDGERYRSRSLPSTFATWKEYRRLNRRLRLHGKVLQSAPNTTRPLNVFLFMVESAGFFVRKKLRTSLLVAADTKAMPSKAVHFLLGLFRGANKLLRSDLTWQHLPVPFEVYADGIDFVIFEEFGAGQLALHLQDEVERNKLMQNEGFRRQFRHQLDNQIDFRLWTRDLHDTEIVDCPDRSVIGKSFGQVADECGLHPGDAFLDLVVAHGRKLRWRMVLANHRPEVLDEIASHPSLQMGFADSGAHLRNMAFYNMPVRFLRRVREAELAGKPFMSTEQAVHRLTGELADYYDVDAGKLHVGSRADVVIIDPEGLNASVDELHESVIPEFGNFSRLSNSSDSAVMAALIAGQLVYREGSFAEGFGNDYRTGRFLRAGESMQVDDGHRVDGGT
ncbi:amidohydrolase family protein [Pseudidiomarina sp.]|uniref:N-acyl-D-amino-acid deacylase family protein n=1 Tax=Pseudidiomarina sp. TaxID=2081707 RepID=UPI00299D3808|nr:amidohydrolase family protein [Pseudidiomarina sp.]MDX1706875.1 amidohydrolase family protein [Pseudidiomarina sp.]